MKLLQSSKFKIPTLYHIWDKNQIKELPIGVPFIFADENLESKLVRFLEFEILYQNAIKSGYPFNFKMILEENGYETNVFGYNSPVKMTYITEEIYDSMLEHDLSGTDYDIDKLLDSDSYSFDQYITDTSAYVDVQKLKDLKVFPVWMNIIEDALVTNIHNFAVFNNNMYNKKLEGMYGALELISPKRNLINIDISGSIPKAVSTTILLLSKNLAETFYADILITGSKTTLYEYENLHILNIEKVYKENGMDNDQTYFKKLVSESEKHYDTVIAFGDYHSPSRAWSNIYNTKTKSISTEDGKKLCKWKINKAISFHTTTNSDICGYLDWFTIEEDNITHISNWVKYLNK